jgi:hypothetical protein
MPLFYTTKLLIVTTILAAAVTLFASSVSTHVAAGWFFTSRVYVGLFQTCFVWEGGGNTTIPRRCFDDAHAGCNDHVATLRGAAACTVLATLGAALLWVFSITRMMRSLLRALPVRYFLVSALVILLFGVIGFALGFRLYDSSFCGELSLKAGGYTIGPSAPLGLCGAIVTVIALAVEVYMSDAEDEAAKQAAEQSMAGYGALRA